MRTSVCGLSEERAYDYWINRFDNQKESVVDFVKHDRGQAEDLFQERVRFFFEGEVSCPRNLRTLDFGCGIGRYSIFFDKYLGLDLNDKIVECASAGHPDKSFCIYEKENRGNTVFHFNEQVKQFNPQLFFTSTVLQHCNDNFVLRIFNSLYSIMRENEFTFFLYENDQVQQSHVCGRPPDRYAKMIGYFFGIKEVQTKSHIVHGEKHTITKIVCFC